MTCKVWMVEVNSCKYSFYTCKVSHNSNFHINDWLALEEICILKNFRTHALACCHAPSQNISFGSNYGVIFGWGNGKRLGIQEYLGYCCRWGIAMPAWRWQQSQTFRCSCAWSEGRPSLVMFQRRYHLFSFSTSSWRSGACGTSHCFVCILYSWRTNV